MGQAQMSEHTDRRTTATQRILLTRNALVGPHTYQSMDRCATARVTTDRLRWFIVPSVNPAAVDLSSTARAVVWEEWCGNNTSGGVLQGNKYLDISILISWISRSCGAAGRIHNLTSLSLTTSLSLDELLRHHLGRLCKGAGTLVASRCSVVPHESSPPIREVQEEQ